LSIAFTSASTSVAVLEKPRWLGAPGRTSNRLEPMALMRSITTCLAPSPMASMAITEATPITMPSSVRMARNTLARRARSAVLAASTTSLRCEMRPARAVQFCAASAAWPSGGRGPGSARMWPSLISITRCACWATSAAWVMRITVCPCAARSLSRTITSAPLLLSSAPVGSSARITRPPFIRARAIDTRCCWPPESWFGRWCMRSPRPSEPSNSLAR
jgi:hypothetical protein